MILGCRLLENHLHNKKAVKQMTIALNIFAALLAFAAIGSAVSKLKKVPDVMEAMAKVGVKTNQIPVLHF
jgi:hypothetical protein